MLGTTAKLNRGIITSYDPTTLTATITPYNNSGTISNAACPVTRYDPMSGAFSITPPNIGTPCVFVEVGDNEAYILSMFPPPNINGMDNQNVKSPLNATVNRTPTGMRNNNTLPGNPSATNAMGSEETFTDMVKKIIMSPGKLSSIWNLLNCVWENVCSIFRLRAGGVDVFCEVDENNNTNTTINVRRTVSERQGTNVINLEMGQSAGIITLNINGNEFLHIDADRNTTITAANVTLNARNIVYNADNFNCLNVGQVELP